jgi:hypothetical protein
MSTIAWPCYFSKFTSLMLVVSHVSCFYRDRRPNAHNEDNDKMCEDVTVTAPTSALLISSRHIQAASVVLDTPSHLANLHVNLCCLMLGNKWTLWNVDDLWTMWTVGLVTHVNYWTMWIVSYVGHLWACVVLMFVNLWSVNWYMKLLCGLWYVICQLVSYAGKKWEKNFVPRSVAPAGTAQQP